MSKEFLKTFLEKAMGVRYSFFEVSEAGVKCQESASGVKREYSKKHLFGLLEKVLGE